jgi:hypothetical protein
MDAHNSYWAITYQVPLRQDQGSGQVLHEHYVSVAKQSHT